MDVIAERYVQLKNILCDVSLECDDGVVVSAHRVVLASASTEFLSMFKESQTDTIRMYKIKSEDLRQLAKFAYTFEADINEEDYNQEKLLYFKFYKCVQLFKTNGKLPKDMAKSYKRFYEFFQKQTLCDVTLECEDGSEIAAHRVVLGSASSWFLANSPCRNGKIPVKEVKSEVLKSIVKFAYTSELDIEEGNLLELLKAADFFGLKDTTHLFYEYIDSHLNPTNCLDLVITLAELNLNEILHSLCFDYVLNHFR
ncbi:kelch-like protein 23 isoform X2 [Adelges cooleyi]|uniref:kelch-like protein 23 isoform X2 n=1 Tax=Adelges cooleyi TaxID=133065 RepID=UPI00217F51D1|nr:kelch-like protein 23 isoform X2 [Adelges cooleyi]XP_050426373.1 kelch-like protein 23 isoform X2 [Adelges cooleyi]